MQLAETHVSHEEGHGHGVTVEQRDHQVPQGDALV